MTISRPNGVPPRSARTKRVRAGELVRRLRRRFAPGALLHCGHGKWYPGEAQPRWAFSLYWRRDGKPVWRDAALIAGDAADAAPARRRMRRPLPTRVAAQLGLASGHVMPAFEDPMHLLVQEAELPINIDPLDPDLANADARARTVRALQQGLGRPAGFVLPLWPTHSGASTRWISEAWEFRRGRLMLLSGDGPIGDRLPLGALPQLALGDYPVGDPIDPLAELGELPDPESLRAARETAAAAAAHAGAVRTALCVEPRDGKLCVFMPPLDRLEDYLALVGAVEAAAAERNVPVQIEGYRPPDDPRLNVLRVTPDPGVIEVNVHPATSWRAAVEITRGVYEDAQLTRLGTRKIPHGRPPDRHRWRQSCGARSRQAGRTARSCAGPISSRASCSTGSGTRRCHTCSPASSSVRPARRRASTRRATIRCTSWRSRCRTCRCRARATPPRPWLVDRLFRNLLVDVTGNTHRAEICIDKLFSPDTATGPLGPRRVPCIRNAARRAHEPRAAAARARARRLVLARAADRRLRALGHRAA